MSLSNGFKVKLIKLCKIFAPFCNFDVTKRLIKDPNGKY